MYFQTFFVLYINLGTTVVIIVMLLQFFSIENSENDPKLKEWIDCGI